MPIDERTKAAEADLARRAALGDPAALDGLVRSVAPAVRSVVRDQLVNPADVDEVSQDVLARVVEQIGSLHDPVRVRPWVLAIARNAAIDRRRRNRRRVVLSTDDERIELSDDGPALDELSELRELVRAVEQGVGRLSPRDATILDLVARLGFTPTEIAGVLGITPNAAKVALHRARRRLCHAIVVDAVLAGRAELCDEFHLRYESDGLDAALRHARECTECGRRRARTTAGYGAHHHRA